MTAPTERLRVLVVEDEAMVALLVEDMLVELGHEVAAIASRMQDAADLARTASFDVAIIDVNLDGRPSYPIADILAGRGIPFIFATGYGRKGIDPKYADARLLPKPFMSGDLAKLLLEIAPASGRPQRQARPSA